MGLISVWGTKIPQVSGQLSPCTATREPMSSRACGPREKSMSHTSREALTCPNSPSQASTVHELRTSRCSSWIQKRQKNQRSNCQHPLDNRKSKRVPEKYLLLLYWLHQSIWLCESQQAVENFSREGNTISDLPPEKSVCSSRSNS